jgi:hypothetical protein
MQSSSASFDAFLQQFPQDLSGMIFSTARGTDRDAEKIRPGVSEVPDLPSRYHREQTERCSQKEFRERVLRRFFHVLDQFTYEPCGTAEIVRKVLVLLDNNLHELVS